MKSLIRILLFLLLFPYALAVLYIFVPPVSTLMLADAVMLESPKRDWVPLKQISRHLIGAVVLAEDAAFCDHWGFDFNAIEKSLDRAAEGKRYGGASTITQQTAKNLFLWNGRSWFRKALEAPLALWIELIWSKQRILEVYLNIAEWGPNVYGVEAASDYHFGTKAANLSPKQAGLLAAALPDPTRRHAGKPSENQRATALGIELRTFGSGADLSCLK